jgi:hypothetical protein
MATDAALSTAPDKLNSSKCGHYAPVPCLNKKINKIIYYKLKEIDYGKRRGFCRSNININYC